MPFIPISKLAGVGPKTAQKLYRLGIKTTIDLVYHFPHRYIDFSQVVPIRQAKIDQNITIHGIITDFKDIYTKNHKNIQIATVSDGTGTILLIWFNQPYLKSVFTIGAEFSFAGTTSFYQRKICIFSPEYGSYNTGKIIAIYPETSGLTSKWFRKTISQNLDTITQEIADPIPLEIRQKYHLMEITDAMRQIHLPESEDLLTSARYRLSLDEFLALQAVSFQRRQQWLSHSPAKPLQDTPNIDKLIKSLPFKLTSTQIQAWSEIRQDLLSSNKIMNRLLQGDVGSGKTIIAVLASLLTATNHQISLIVAPTEVLAKQHFQNFQKFLKPFKIPIHLLTANQQTDLSKIPANSVVISTHAVIFHHHKLQKPVGLLVIDEQHRFGVKQRNFLSHLDNTPHCLTMTATPIPRTISLTFLGNLDISTIDAPPQNRHPIKTFLVPPSKLADCFRWLNTHIQQNHTQAFYVCPLIEESENLASIKAATKEYQQLSTKIFPNLKLALIHGKIPKPQQDKIIKLFQQDKIDILVTTPIIEVGIDIPNASTIIIQSADRFGLAQLHQLRGRVGRGSQQSYCYLLTESRNEKALNRLKFLQTHTNGMDIANFDLQSRGPGEVFSTAQHGFPSLKIADISDFQLISQSRKIIQELVGIPKFNPKSLCQQLADNFSLTN